MSRTYRYRHGFDNRRGVLYTESRLRHRDTLVEKQLIYELAHETYNYPCMMGMGRWRRYYNLTQDQYSYYWYEYKDHNECLPWGRAWEQVRQLLRLRLRVQSHWHNPHIGYGAQFCGRKKYYRTEGNRRGRHHDKQKLHMLLNHGTNELRRAYAMHDSYCGSASCNDCGSYFVTDDRAAKALERGLSRQDINWDSWDLT